MSAATPALTLENAGVCYRGGILRRHEHWALQDLTLEIYRGENIGVIGVNGAGKSTLLRLLSGIYQPDAGTINHHGNKASLLSLQVGFVPHLSGKENAILSGMLLGKTRQEMTELIPEIIKYSELDLSFYRPIRTYSSGMKARLGFAVSYFADADTLLVDEILGVGDSGFREKSANTMRERIQSNRTVVLVSHNPKMISSLCSRVAWLEKGRLRAVGGLELLDEYEASARSQPLKL